MNNPQTFTYTLCTLQLHALTHHTIQLFNLMPRYIISTQPRPRGPSFTSSASETTLLDTSTLTMSSVHTLNPHGKCIYCPAMLKNDSVCPQHITTAPECASAECTTLHRVEDRECRQAEAAVPLTQQCRVTVEEIPDQDKVPHHSVTSCLGPSLPGPSTAGSSSVSTPVDTGLGSSQTGLSQPAQTLATGPDWTAHCWLCCWGGLYVKDYLDTLTGAPIQTSMHQQPTWTSICSPVVQRQI